MAKKTVSKKSAPVIMGTKGIKPFKIDYTLLDENPIERTSPNPPGYMYVRASWKDRDKKECSGLVILSIDEVKELRKKKNK